MLFSCTGSEKTNPDTSGKSRFYIKSIDFGDFLEVSVRYHFPAQAGGETYPDTSGKWRFYIKSIDFDDFLEVSVRYRFPAQGRGILNRHLRTCPQCG